MTLEIPHKVDAVIVGAGFAGIYALHQMNKLGLSAVVIETADGIGGTWYWNKYPGARCDVESFQYSYSFDEELQQSWQWSERYAMQPEILSYLKHVVERFNLLDQIRLQTKVEKAQWNESEENWQVTTSKGKFQSRFLLMASGSLSKPNMPAIKGLDTYNGSLIHTGYWPQEGINLRGKTVGVIGTGSSGVQVISNIAQDVIDLHVFQRTPHWVVPAKNRPTTPEQEQQVKARYPELRQELSSSLLGMAIKSPGGNASDADEAERQQRYENAWEIGGSSYLMSFDDLLFNTESNATACEFVAQKIRDTVQDPTTANALIPDIARYPIGARRLVLEDNYYSRFNQPNVHLKDTLKDPIKEITPKGITLESGEHTELDVIIIATGFDALTGALLDIDIVGKNDVSLKETWANGPCSYLGIAVGGFPNMFTITGPGSPSVFSNMVLSLEQHVSFATDMINWMQDKNLTTTEAEASAQQQWGERVIEVAKPTVLMKVNSWYWGANVEGKPKVFLPYLGGVGTYRDECIEIVKEDYRGFSFK